jgi:hypothetical protein
MDRERKIKILAELGFVSIDVFEAVVQESPEEDESIQEKDDGIQEKDDENTDLLEIKKLILKAIMRDLKAKLPSREIAYRYPADLILKAKKRLKKKRLRALIKKAFQP